MSSYAMWVPFDLSYIKICYNEISLHAILFPVDERKKLAILKKAKFPHKIFLITKKTLIPHKFAEISS